MLSLQLTCLKEFQLRQKLFDDQDVLSLTALIHQLGEVEALNSDIFGLTTESLLCHHVSHQVV